MQFQVPQFIEVEDKIFGPLTFKQFIYLAGGLGISFVLFAYLPFFFAVLFIIPVMGLSLALSFYKVHNRPFILILEAAFRYALSSKLYIWKREQKKPGVKEKKESASPDIEIPRFSDSKLKDLSWGLDVHKNVQ